MKRIVLVVIVAVGMLLTIPACRRETSKAIPESSQNLMKIRDAARKAVGKLYRPPMNRQELLPYLQELGDPQEILRSPDDGEEYVILWGTNPDANPAVACAYEKHGKAGRRYVLWGHIVWSMTDEELKKVPFPAGQRSPF